MKLSALFVILLILSTLFLSACDTGEMCDELGNCEPAAQEDRSTLEPNILEEIGTDDVEEESP